MGIAGCDLFLFVVVSLFFLCMGGLSNLANLALLLLFSWDFTMGILSSKGIGRTCLFLEFCIREGNWAWSKAPVFILSHSGSGFVKLTRLYS